MIVGLLSPDEGNVTVLGEPAGSARTLPPIAFLAQDLASRRLAGPVVYRVLRCPV